MTLHHTLGVSSEGLSAAADRLRIHANNIANASTPYYQRKLPGLQQTHDTSFASMLSSMHGGAARSVSSGGVSVVGYALDPTEGKKIHSPGHPEADKDGYITTSNVNVLSDMSDAIVSQRIYEANLSVISISKAMANRALEIGKG